MTHSFKKYKFAILWGRNNLAEILVSDRKTGAVIKPNLHIETTEWKVIDALQNMVNNKAMSADAADDLMETIENFAQYRYNDGYSAGSDAAETRAAEDAAGEDL
jgi:hypothetical protein